MSIENLRIGLQKSAELEIQNILQKARKEAEDIINESKIKVEKIKKERLEARLEELKKKSEVELSTSRSGQRLALANTKDELLQHVFSDAKNQLKEAAENIEPQYMRFLQDSILKGTKNLPGNQFVVYSSNRDKKALKKALAGIRKKIAEMRGSRTVFELSSENIDTIGGVIICAKDANRCYNSTLDAKMDEFIENHSSEVTAILLEEA